MSTIYHAPLADLEFLLHDVLGLEAVLTAESFGHVDRDAVGAVLSAGARFAEQVLSPINGAGDRDPARLEGGRVVMPAGYVEAYRRYAADGWLGLDLPERYGGQGFPRVVQAAFAEMSNGACLAFSMLPVMNRAAARLLLAHGGEAAVLEHVPSLVDGTATATIVITEPQAGSDVGRIQTLATPHADGRFRLHGAKIFITFGDHGFTDQIIHMVLARTPGAAAGTRGISLFLVPKWRTVAGARAAHGVTVPRVEHKMGLLGSRNPLCARASAGRSTGPTAATDH